MTERITLYDVLEYKVEKSVLKSVSINCGLAESHPIIEIEPYDTTGTNALDTTPAKYDSAINYVERKLIDLYRDRPEKLKKYIGETRDNMVWIYVYSNVYYHIELLLNLKTGKEF